MEDIFSGGNGWGTQQDSSNTDTDDGDGGARTGTLRPRDIRRMGLLSNARPPHVNHRRTNSASSDKSAATVTAIARERASAAAARNARLGLGRYDDSKGSETGLSHRGSLASLNTAGTLGSDHAWKDDGALHAAKEVKEADAREDLVAWRLPSD